MISSDRVLTGARKFTAFCLNLVAAILGPAILGGGLSRLMYVHWRWMSMPERQFLVSIVFAAVAAFCVSKFWTTTTAKWVWIVPLPLLLVRMAIFSMGPTHGSVMQDSAFHPAFWQHFFAPDPSKTDGGFAEYRDFLVFTNGAVRATTYSLTAWALARWEQSRIRSLPVEQTSDVPSPVKPAIWAAPELEWFAATNLLIVANVGVFVAMVASGAPVFIHSSYHIEKWGANIGSHTLHGEPWRLITHSFLHWDFFHLAANMMCLWWIGRIVERIVGPWVVTGVYVLASIVAGALRSIVYPLSLSAGASASILGLAGFLIAMVFQEKLSISHNQLFRWRLSIFCFFFLLSSLSPFVDNIAHLAGFITGLLLGLIFTKSIRVSSSHSIFLPAKLFAARDSIEKEEYLQAIERLQIGVEAAPGVGESHALLGYSFHALQRYDDAAREYKLALDLGYTNEVLRNNLAEVSACPGTVTVENAKTTSTGSMS